MTMHDQAYERDPYWAIKNSLQCIQNNQIRGIIIFHALCCCPRLWTLSVGKTFGPTSANILQIYHSCSKLKEQIITVDDAFAS